VDGARPGPVHHCAGDRRHSDWPVEARSPLAPLHDVPVRWMIFGFVSPPVKVNSHVAFTTGAGFPFVNVTGCGSRPPSVSSFTW
jgi:hypothetical protein